MGSLIRIVLLFMSVMTVVPLVAVYGAPREQSVTANAQHQAQVIDLQSEQNSESEYFFALTRYVMASSLPTYAKPFLFVFSFGLDIGMLPFALVGEAINQANEAS